MVRNLLTNKKESDKINMVREWRNPSDFLCGCGGIGRRARFRFWWETVQVQVLLPALDSVKSKSGGIVSDAAAFVIRSFSFLFLFSLYFPFLKFFLLRLSKNF